MSEKQNKNLEFQITQYLDGLLDKEESAQLEAQLQADPELRKVFNDYQALHVNLESLAEDLPEMNFGLQRQQIMSQIALKTQAMPVKLTRRIFKPVFALAAVAAIVLIAFGVLMVARNKLPGTKIQAIESVALRPSPVHTGTVIATISPASSEITTNELVQVLAKRMNVRLVKRVVKPSSGTVLVFVGAQDFTSEEEVEAETFEDYLF